MRIISGIYKGKIIRVPENLPARPTTDFAKTGLFNMLSHRIDFKKCDVLDLFSGTGNISFEFISRLCKSVTSVDDNFSCVKFINLMFEELNTKNSSVIRSDVYEFIKKCNSRFDIIFADPPYETKDYVELIELIVEKELLKEKGIFILEHQSKKHFTDHRFFGEERKFGNVGFSFFAPVSS